MGNQMIYSSSPATDVTGENGKHLELVYAVASIQGWRKKQEDAYKIVTEFHDGLSYFAVFDGHGGSEIAEFLKIQLHNYIKGFLEENEDIELALHLGFLSCDASLRDPAVKAILNGMIAQEDNAAARILKSHLLGVLSSGSGEICQAGPSLESIRDKLGDIKACGLGPSEGGSSTAKPHEEGPSGADKPENVSANHPIPTGDEVVGSSGGPEDGDGHDDANAASGEGPGPSGSGLVPFGDGPGTSRGAPIATPGAEDGDSIQYLLNEDLESSDSEDHDFDVEDEESSSESTEEEMCVDPEAILTQEPGDLSGSTATIALLSQSKVYVANVGDTKCVLSRNSVAIDMTLDHSPHNPEELIRIKGAGGSVSADGRVNNVINLSRAFGDFQLKGPSNIPAEQPITAEPYIKSIDIQEGDDFLVIASDGIWNSFTSQGLVDYINVRMKAGDCTLKSVCEEIFKFIMPLKLSDDGTGCDNMTMLIIKFKAAVEDSDILVEDSDILVEDSRILVDEGPEVMEVMEVQQLSPDESDTDVEEFLEEAPTEELPSSSTEVVSIINVDMPVPTEVDSTSNEIDSTSSSNQPIITPQRVPVINLVEQREIEVVDLDP